MGFMVKCAASMKLSLANDTFHEAWLFNIQGKERSHDPVVRNLESPKSSQLLGCGERMHFMIKHAGNTKLSLAINLCHEALFYNTEGKERSEVMTLL